MSRRTAQTALSASPELYERDFAAWASEQAALLRAGRIGQADIPHIAEELDSLGRSEYRELRSNLTRILQHMLKWDHQPRRRSKSWAVSIAVHRRNLEECLEDNPSLRARQGEAVAQAYRRAVAEVVDETGLAATDLPSDCPYDWAAITTRHFTVGGYTTP